MTCKHLQILIAALCTAWLCVACAERSANISTATAPATPSAVDLALKTPNFENEINAGLELSKAGNYQGAITYFEKALKRSPESPIALNNICAQYNNMQNWLTAITTCQQALKRAPNFQLAKNNLKFAELKLQVRQAELTKSSLHIANAPPEKQRQLNVDLGFEYYRMGDYPRAIAIWKKVADKNDDLSARTFNNLGSAYILTKNFPAARKNLELALRRQPSNQLVKNNIAWLNSLELKK